MKTPVDAGSVEVGARDLKSSAPPIEPTSNGSQPPGADTVRCRRCSWEGDSGGTGKGQCPECGCFLPTNTAALVHGGRRLLDGYGSHLLSGKALTALPDFT